MPQRPPVANPSAVSRIRPATSPWRLPAWDGVIGPTGPRRRVAPPRNRIRPPTKKPRGGAPTSEYSHPIIISRRGHRSIRKPPIPNCIVGRGTPLSQTHCRRGGKYRRISSPSIRGITTNATEPPPTPRIYAHRHSARGSKKNKFASLSAESQSYNVVPPVVNRQLADNTQENIADIPTRATHFAHQRISGSGSCDNLINFSNLIN